MPPQKAPPINTEIPGQPTSGTSEVWKIVSLVLVIVAGGVYWYVMQGGVEKTPETSVYENTEYGYQFEYPHSLTVQPATSRVLQMIETEETVLLPVGSVEIPGYMIVSAVPYSELSAEKPIYDYYNCCTGMTYWFDSEKKEWQANSITYDVAIDPQTRQEPVSLNSNGACSLVQTFGPRTFYKIESGDEGIPTDVYYFLPTNKGYALRFLTAHDVQADYSGYAEEVKPDPNILKTIGEILASVALTNDTVEVKATCR